jgi:hypothetical protein
MKTNVSAVKRTLNVANKSKKATSARTNKINAIVKNDAIAEAKKATKEIKREILREETEKVLSTTKKPVMKPYIADEVKADAEETKKILMIPVKKGSNVVEKEKKEKLPVVKKEKGPSVVDVLTPFIEKGKYTKKELIAMGKEKLPHLTESTLSTMLTDSKNPKYNKFAKLTEITEDGKIRFVK